MSSIKTTTPYRLRLTNQVLARLRSNHVRSLADGGANIHIPVLALIDYELVVNETTAELRSKDVIFSDSLDNTADTDGRVGSKSVHDINFDHEKPLHLVEASDLAPRSKHDLATLVVLTMPVVKPLVIERILSILTGRGQFRWAFLHTRVTKRYVFVKLPSLASTKAFISVARSVFDVSFLSDVFGDVESAEAGPNLALLVSDVTKLLQQPKGQEAELPLDAAKEYTIDNSELIDVPSHMKSSIIDEIVEFRLKVVRDEARRRAQEAELEQNRAKQKLKEMYERITLDVDSTGVVSMEYEASPSNVRDEQNNMDDNQYSQHIKDEKKKQNLKRYAAMLTAVKNKEHIERLNLEEQLLRLSRYEEDINASKDRFLEELSMMAMGEPSSKWLLLPDILSYHGANYPYYQKKRAEKRAREQAWDEEDRKDEANSLQVKLEVDETPETKRPHVSKFTDREVIFDEKLSAKIAELSETYVGLVDETLIEIITSNLKKTGTRGSANLVKELKEVLDDDAQILVDELFDFILKL